MVSTPSPGKGRAEYLSCTHTFYVQRRMLVLSLCARNTPVKSTRWGPQLQGQCGCRTTHSKNLCQFGSSAAGFSTSNALLAFRRRCHPFLSPDHVVAKVFLSGRYYPSDNRGTAVPDAPAQAPALPWPSCL